MAEFQHKRSEYKEKSAVSASARARDMLCELSGPRGWNDTRESWLARGARRVGLSLRRARAIFYQEPIRLTADEYLGIENAWKAAGAALATLSDMARDADVRARDRLKDGSRDAEDQGGHADHEAHPGPAATPAAR